MNLMDKKKVFEVEKKIFESAKLIFHGVDGYDVYNPSIPFQRDGKTYIFGRIERRNEWSRSWVRLFENTGKDIWTIVPGSMIYQLEDPFVSLIDDKLVLGGTHVRNKCDKLDTYYCYFYKGSNINDLYYFTTGPDYMKDIRLVQLGNGKIGVFSRPRSKELLKKIGVESQIGFTIINNLSELNAEVVENAPYIEGLFENGEWGGCNQAYYLDSGLIGVIGHKCCKHSDINGIEILTYLNISFIFDVQNHQALNIKIIGTRNCYPEGPSKLPDLVDCAFTSGIVMRDDNYCDLFSGIGDCEVGRIAIDYPFKGFGKIAI